MLAVFNAGGELITLTPSQVNQGSNKANTIYIVMPLAPTNVLHARFRLPNGKFTKPVAVPVAPETGYLGLTDQDGNQLYMWAYTIPSALTAYAGNVLAQFTATNEELVTKNEQVTNEERVLATFSFEFEVLEGVPPITVGNIDSYQSVIDALQSINIAITNNVNTLQSEINELENTKQNKTDSALQTESKQVVGAINELNTEIEQLKDTGAGTTVTVNGQAVSVFNADTKLDVTAFKEYEAKIDAILEQSEIITIDEISGQYEKRKTANGENIVNGSTVEVLSVDGNTGRYENILPEALTVVNTNSYASVSVIGRRVQLSILNIPPIGERDFIRVTPDNAVLTPGTYTLAGSPANSTNFSPHLIITLFDKNTNEQVNQFEDFGEGVSFATTYEYYYAVNITFGSAVFVGQSLIFYVELNKGLGRGLKNASFAGIRSYSDILPLFLETPTLEDATITVVGRQVKFTITNTPSGDERNFARLTPINNVIMPGSYRLSGSPANSTDFSPHLVVTINNINTGEEIAQYEDFGKGVTFSVEESSYFAVYIAYGKDGIVGQELTFDVSLIQKNADGTTKESTFNFPQTELPIGTTLNLVTMRKTNTWAEYTFTGNERWDMGGAAPTGYERWYHSLPFLNASVKPYYPCVCDRYPAYVNTVNPDITAVSGLELSGITVSHGVQGTLNFQIMIPKSIAETITMATIQQLTQGMTVRYLTTPANTAWYKTEPFTQDQVNAGNSYEAYYEGKEVVLGNDEANTVAKNTITAEYVVVNKVK